MEKVTKNTVIDKLKFMFIAFDKEVTKELVAFYVECLSDDGYTCKQILHGIKEASKIARYGCPKPADILDCIKPSESDYRVKAGEEWAKLDRAVRNGYEISKLTDDPVTIKLCDGRYHPRILEDYSERDFTFVQKQFIDDYISYFDSKQGKEEARALIDSAQAPKLVEEMAKRLEVPK